MAKNKKRSSAGPKQKGVGRRVQTHEKDNVVGQAKSPETEEDQKKSQNKKDANQKVSPSKDSSGKDKQNKGNLSARKSFEIVDELQVSDEPKQIGYEKNSKYEPLKFVDDEDEKNYIKSNKGSYMCHDCGTTFETFTELSDHLFSHPYSKPRMCEKCGTGFLNMDQLNRHKGQMRNCSSEMPFECNKCTAGFTTKFLLEFHEKSHDNPELIKCRRCGKTFNSGSAYLSHCTGENRICAPTVGMIKDLETEEYNSSNLSMIKELLNDKCTLSCDVCKETFESPSEMYVHLQSHSGFNAYICFHCGVGFDNMEKGKKKTHNSKCKKELFGHGNECNICHEYCASPDLLTLHKKEHYCIFLYQCHTCHTLFKLGRSLYYHLNDPKTKCKLLKGDSVNINTMKLNISLEQQEAYEKFRKENPVQTLEKSSDKSAVGGNEELEGQTSDGRKGAARSRNETTDNEQNQCIFTGNFFNETTDFGNHVSCQQFRVKIVGELNNDKDIFKCDTCDSTFQYFHKIYAHMMDHAFFYHDFCICDSCGHGVKSAMTLKLHKLKHLAASQNLPFECSICREKFENVDLLEMHNEVKHKLKPLLFCEACDLGFTDKFSFKKHYDFHDGKMLKYSKGNTTKKLPTTFKCSMCEKTFANKSNMKRHIRDIHPLNCQSCNVKCSSIQEMRMHVKEHPEDNPYKCSWCGSMYAYPDDLRFHIKVHELKETGLKVCRLCNIQFIDDKKYKNHMKHHKCETCGISLRSIEAADNHVKDCKPNPKTPVHVCEWCGTALTSAMTYIDHIFEKHVPDRSLHCSICLEKFPNTFDLEQHVKNDHTNSNEKYFDEIDKMNEVPSFISEEMEKVDECNTSCAKKSEKPKTYLQQYKEFAMPKYDSGEASDKSNVDLHNTSNSDNKQSFLDKHLNETSDYKTRSGRKVSCPLKLKGTDEDSTYKKKSPISKFFEKKGKIIEKKKKEVVNLGIDKADSTREKNLDKEKCNTEESEQVSIPLFTEISDVQSDQVSSMIPEKIAEKLKSVGKKTKRKLNVKEKNVDAEVADEKLKEKKRKAQPSSELSTPVRKSGRKTICSAKFKMAVESGAVKTGGLKKVLCSKHVVPEQAESAENKKGKNVHKENIKQETAVYDKAETQVYSNYQQFKQELVEILDSQASSDENNASAETKEEPAKIYNCAHCDLKFGSYYLLYLHLFSYHSGIMYHVCLTCGTGFKILKNKRISSKEYILKHEKTHDEKALTFECDIDGCSKCFKYEELLNLHKETDHEGNPVLSCNICGTILTTDGNFAHHYKNCFIKTYVEPITGEKYMKMDETLEIENGDNDNSLPISHFVFNCGLCKSGFNDLEIFFYHLYLHVPDDKMPTFCWNCGYGNIGKEDHIKIHGGEGCSLLKHSCNVKGCNERFASVKLQKLHETHHMGNTQGQYECYFCSEKVGNLTTLLKHFDSHELSCKNSKQMIDTEREETVMSVSENSKLENQLTGASNKDSVKNDNCSDRETTLHELTVPELFLKLITVKDLKNAGFCFEKEKEKGIFFCEHCENSFNDYAEFFLHLKNDHGGYSAKICLICGNGANLSYCTMKKWLEKHQHKNETDNFDHVCENCQFGSFKPELIGLHKRTHAGKGLITCKTCRKDFDSGPMYAIHMTACSGNQISSDFTTKELNENVLEKEMLTRKISSSESLNVSGAHNIGGINKTKMRKRLMQRKKLLELQHKFRTARESIIKLKTTMKPLNGIKCCVCKRFFNYGSYMCEHGRTEKYLKAAVCTICGRIFRSSRSLKTHIRRMHSKKTLSCNLCGWEFTLKQDLINHLSVVHNTVYDEVIPSFDHEYMSKLKAPQNIDKNGLRVDQNMKTSTIRSSNVEDYIGREDGKLFCTICGMTLLKKTIKPHIRRMHLKEKNEICEYCNKAFVFKNDLEGHIEVCHGQKQKCTICNFYSKSKRGLRLHIKNMHKDVPLEMRFSCTYCKIKFDHIKDFNNHKRLYHTITKFNCNECGKTMASARGLRLHLERIHQRKTVPEKVNLDTVAMSNNKTSPSKITTASMTKHGMNIKTEDELQKLVEKSKFPLKRKEDPNKKRQIETEEAVAYIQHMLIQSSPKPVKKSHGQRSTAHACSTSMSDKNDDVQIVESSKESSGTKRSHEEIEEVVNTDEFCVCDQCGSLFIDNSSLNNHRKNVHDKPVLYCCNFCGEILDSFNNAAFHKKKFHKKIKHYSTCFREVLPSQQQRKQILDHQSKILTDEKREDNQIDTNFNDSRPEELDDNSDGREFFGEPETEYAPTEYQSPVKKLKTSEPGTSSNYTSVDQNKSPLKNPVETEIKQTTYQHFLNKRKPEIASGTSKANTSKKEKPKKLMCLDMKMLKQTGLNPKTVLCISNEKIDDETTNDSGKFEKSKESSKSSIDCLNVSDLENIANSSSITVMAVDDTGLENVENVMSVATECTTTDFDKNEVSEIKSAADANENIEFSLKLETDSDDNNETQESDNDVKEKKIKPQTITENQENIENSETPNVCTLDDLVDIIDTHVYNIGSENGARSNASITDVVHTVEIENEQSKNDDQPQPAPFTITSTESITLDGKTNNFTFKSEETSYIAENLDDQSEKIVHQVINVPRNMREPYQAIIRLEDAVEGTHNSIVNLPEDVTSVDVTVANMDTKDEDVYILFLV